MKNIDIEIDETAIIIVVLIIMLSTFCIFGIIEDSKLNIEKEKTKQLEMQLQMEQKQEV